jgi:hypothetical protein
MKRIEPKQHWFERISLVSGTALGLAWLLALGACSQPAPSNDGHASHTPTASPQAKMTPRIPDHFATAQAAKPLTPTLDPRQFTVSYVVKSYQLAKEIPEVLAQQPCYCYCDTGFGHKSLLDCHKDNHSAECLVCIKEALLTGQLHKAGKSAAEIRAAIVRGDWQQISLN